MKVFFDTEFTGLKQNAQLISIGMISEYDQTFYAEFTDWDWSDDDDDKWIYDNVISKLRYVMGPDRSSEVFNDSEDCMELYGTSIFIREYIERWLKDIIMLDYSAPIEFWADCYAWDWVLFCELWGGAFGVPDYISYIPFDISTLFKIAGIDPDINREKFVNMQSASGMKHNALWDARVVKTCYDKLRGILNDLSCCGI